MAIDARLETNQLQGGYVLRLLVDALERSVIQEIIEKVPKIVAEQYVKEHMQEIMEKVSPTEIASCIASAVAQKVADAYKPKDDPNTVALDAGHPIT